MTRDVVQRQLFAMLGLRHLSTSTPSWWRSLMAFAAGFLLAVTLLPACHRADGNPGNEISCPAGQTACGQRCVDVSRDPRSCGGCGIPCSTGQVCQGGSCRCVSGLVCNDACIPPDANHCGGCSTACLSGQLCSDRACSTGCGEGRSVCGTACVVTNGNDAFNCGGCGVPCAAGQLCIGGICVDSSDDAPIMGSGGAMGPTARPAALVTSAPDAYWNTDGTVTLVPGATAEITVKDASTAQLWEGFGGAFNELGWQVLSLLTPDDRETALRLLYGADGARFVFGRIPIGASDYAVDRYTLDETPNSPDPATFSVERDKQMLIPFIRAAQRQKANIRFWASPWTPPTWMKQGPFSGGIDGSPFDGGTMKDDDITMAAFAQYLLRFAQAYAQEGIKIEAISPQNEPGYVGTYPTCGWTPSTYVKFVGGFLGPAIATMGLDLKIILGTFNGGGADSTIVTTVMDDRSARDYIDVFGYQWGMLGHVGSTKRHHLPIWQTEHKCGNYPWLKPFKTDSAPNDHAYAVESWGLLRDWIKAGVSAYSVWNMLLDTQGIGIDSQRIWPQNALLTVDTQTRALTITPAYYVFRHVSQFVPPRSKVVATSGGDALAFQTPDGGTVAIVFNSGPAKTMTVAIAGQKLRFAMPGNGWATVVVPEAARQSALP